MARRRQRSPREERLEANRLAISQGWSNVFRTPLSSLAEAVKFEECSGDPGDPEMGSVDPGAGIVRLNPHHARALSADQWAGHIGHLLLHLGLNHAARREDRDLLLWNVACELSAEGLLPLFGLGQAHGPGAAAGRSEEEVYEEILEFRAAYPKVKQEYRTLAGQHRPDIVGLGRLHLWRRDYEERLAQGIREAVEGTVAEVAYSLGEEANRGGWGPAERARRWVINEFPLLGALATQIRVIADAQLCQRMDISVAAVNGFLGEMYFNPEWKLSQEEWVFIYTHELLHVALLHHSRTRGRDPWTWNLACDFVINGWLVEMGVGRLPTIGVLYDPRLQGMSADEVYDLLVRDPKRCRGLRGFRGKLGDVLLDTPGRTIYRDEVTTLDDLYRRCLSAGMSHLGRGLLPAGLLEEVRSLFSPPVPWDVELGRWMEAHVPFVREPLRSYARASRRQASTPDIPRPARYIPDEWREACTFGVVLDTSGSMDRELLGRALGAIASFSEARDVPRTRLVLCDAAPYDRGWVAPTDLRGIFPVQGRGGTALQPAVIHLLGRPDFPATAPVMIITDGWCEEQIECPREHCFVLPRKRWKEGAIPLRTSAPIFRVLKESHEPDD